MNKSFYIFLILVLFFITPNNFIIASSEIKENYILIKINNEIITVIDVNDEMSYLGAINKNFRSLSKEKKFDIAKNSLIREVIKKDELLKYFIFGQNIKRVDEVIQDLYTSLNLNSEDEAKAYFKSYNISLSKVKHKFEIETLWNTLIYRKFKSNVEVDKDKLKNKIKNNKKSDEITLYMLSEILFKTENKKQMVQKVLDIKNSIKEIGFENTASKFSFSDTAKYGGKIGWIKKNQLSKEMFNRIEKLKIGEVTEAINTPGGQLILKLEDIKTEKVFLNKEKQLEDLIVYETNKQLSNFSNIYFNKILIGIDIDEK